jgi:hypothetical protein
MAGEFWFLAALVGVVPVAILIAWALARFAQASFPEWMLFDTKFFHRLLWPLPIAWLGLFALILLRARWVLGFWPYPGHLDRSPGPTLTTIVESPLDPKTFSMHWLALLVLLVPATLAGFFVAPAHFLLVSRGMRPHWATTTLSIAASAMLWFLIKSDPGGFFLWLAD